MLTDAIIAEVPFDQLVCDLDQASRDAVEYIASAGHSSVAIVGSSIVTDPVAMTFRGYALSHDLVLHGRNMISCRPERQDTRDAFRSFLRGATQIPQVVCCTDGNVACGVLEALRAAGIQVPDDVWVIGYGLAALATTPFYGITTIAPSPRTMAAKLLELLRVRLDAGTAPPLLDALGYHIEPRASTGQVQIGKPWR